MMKNRIMVMRSLIFSFPVFTCIPSTFQGEDTVVFVEGVGECFSHLDSSAGGEVDIVAAGTAFLLPCQHGVPATHGVIDAPEGSIVVVSGDTKAVDESGKHGIGLEFAFLGGAHIGRTDKEDLCFGTALVDIVDLFADGVAIV